MKLKISLCVCIFPIWISAQKLSSADYLERYHRQARLLMSKEGIPASVILGIALHESANGNSKIAKKQNNHFGLKGRFYNRLYKSRYKVFSSVYESYKYFIDLLKNRTVLQPLFEKKETNPIVWLKKISKSGYASDRRWKKKIGAIIEKNRLEYYDTLTFREEEYLDTLNSNIL